MGLVNKEYEIDEELLAERAEDEGDWWAKSYKFYMDVKDKDFNDMTDRQQDWLFQIEKQLEQTP